MQELTTLARPYAVAAYKRAKETLNTQQWSEQLGFLTGLLETPEIAQAANHPAVDKTWFASVILEQCGEGLDTEMRNFVRLLVQNRRLGLIRQICELFRQYKADDEGYIEVEVRSAFAIDEVEQIKLATSLGNVFRKKTHLNISVDPTLIGGIHVRAGDRVIDYSVRGQIQRMAQRLWN
ncbi:F0F1 ATP synthase subunit delta [Candidatus Woesearchaeota archaeon]|nr:F0F1 ATP synthase subunit delta [Candidatus Woesearchaeota archaeon]